jgi:hypothetical protein
MIYLSIFSGVVFASLVALCVFIALRFSEAFKDALLLTQATHSRSMQTLDETLDRFMAVDFSEYKLQRSAENFEFAEQELPDLVEEAEQIIARPRKKGEADEEAILREDFNLA